MKYFILSAISLNAIPLKSIKMIEIINKFLLVGHMFMPEMHLKQPGKTDFIYKNEIDKACFQQDMAYGK